ncbi:hypothetical protein NFI96_023539 [Prochilodus magdalenae]|nr:hypothetical protein NFI96_023539 [Prochilodus magdalenae]
MFASSTNQISAQTSASKTLTLISPPAPVSEMERSRVALITLMCVLISSISGLIVEMRVKPGDDATIYCDCAKQHRFKIAWLRNCSHRQQPPLIMSEGLMRNAPPRYSFVWNISNTTYDLLVRNVSESDLGLLLYCRSTYGDEALLEIEMESILLPWKMFIIPMETEPITFLSFLGESVHSDL